jgi:hypothetical protein
MNERVSISSDVLNKVLAVLQQMPYAQVAGLILAVQSDIQQADKPEIKKAS